MPRRRGDSRGTAARTAPWVWHGQPLRAPSAESRLWERSLRATARSVGAARLRPAAKLWSFAGVWRAAGLWSATQLR